MRTRNVPIEGRAAFEPFSTSGAPEAAVPARLQDHSLITPDKEHLPDPSESGIVAAFGSARLIRHEDGHWELQGGTHAAQAAAREWCSLFQHEAVFTTPSVAAADSEDQTRAIPNKRILVADDDALVRGNVAAVLESEGFVVEEACDGHEAVRRAITHAPNLVLLDLNMPGWDGWTAFSQLDRVTPLVPVIVITARLNQYEAAVKRGVDAFMEKPLNFPILLRAIRHLTSEDSDSHMRRITNRRFVTRLLSGAQRGP